MHASPDGRGRPVGEPFLVLERQVDEDWMRAGTDLDFDFVWQERDDGEYVVREDVPRDPPTGRYRLEIRVARELLRTDSFEVRLSNGLAVRGARLQPSGD